MIDLLKEQLEEYKKAYKALTEICYALAQEGKDWEEYAKKAAGYKIMIEATEIEIIKYENAYENISIHLNLQKSKK